MPCIRSSVQQTVLQRCVHTEGTKTRLVVEPSPLWALSDTQILPHLSRFCLKASHRYDFLPPVRELKMRISKLGIRESCRSLTLDSHLPSSWTPERCSWSMAPPRTSNSSPIFSCLSNPLFVTPSFLRNVFFCHLFEILYLRSVFPKSIVIQLWNYLKHSQM